MNPGNAPGDNSQVAQCPQCQSRFRLTAQHLEAAKGWVQCGVCGHVFYSGLASPAQTVPAAAAPQPATSAPVAPKQETPSPAGSDALNAPVTDSPAAEAPSPILSGLTNRMAENPTTMTFGPKLESIILVDPNATDEDHDPGPLPVIEPRPEPGKAAGLGSSLPPLSAKPPSATNSNWIPRQTVARTDLAKQKKNRLGWLWWLVSIILLLALAAQLVWFMRDSLAAQYPGLRPALAQMCDVFNCDLGLPRDPRQVVILGSDLQTEADGKLVLTINLANKARTRMAWPVLELTLTDVEDQPLARRMFAPSEYLSSPKQETEGIPQLSETPIALNLQSKDIKAAGFRLRMFY